MEWKVVTEIVEPQAERRAAEERAEAEAAERAARLKAEEEARIAAEQKAARDARYAARKEATQAAAERTTSFALRSNSLMRTKALLSANCTRPDEVQQTRRADEHLLDNFIGPSE